MSFGHLENNYEDFSMHLKQMIEKWAADTTLIRIPRSDSESFINGGEAVARHLLELWRRYQKAQLIDEVREAKRRLDAYADEMLGEK